MPTLEFAKLPLVEAAIRLTAARPLPLDLASAVQLHLAMKDRFSRIEDPLEVEHAPGRVGMIELQPGRLLGARYRDHAQGISVGVQPSLVSARWLQSPGGGASYPRFGSLSDALWFALERLRSVFRDVRFDVANMSYTNFVKINAATVSEFLERYFVPNVRPAIMEPNNQFHGLNISWRSAEDIDLRLVIERGEAQLTPVRSEGYKITTIAGIRFEEIDVPVEPVTRIHDRLQVLFGSILSESAKREWGHAES